MVSFSFMAFAFVGLRAVNLNVKPCVSFDRQCHWRKSLLNQSSSGINDMIQFIFVAKSEDGTLILHKKIRTCFDTGLSL